MAGYLSLKRSETNIQQNSGNKGFTMWPETISSLARQNERDESILPTRVQVANQNTRFAPSCSLG